MKDRKKQRIVTAEWLKANAKLIKDITTWRANYHCRNNCADWKKWKFCSHLIRARASYFNKRIEEQVNKLYFLNFGKRRKVDVSSIPSNLYDM